MPATAGRVRMPANNRVHSSRALQTHSIWQSAIGYDPYAPQSESKSQPDTNAYSNFQGLLALAKVTTGSSSNGIETRGACKKCGRLGHLSYQCRNFLSFKKEDGNKEIDAFAPDSISKAAVKEESQSSESDSDSDSSVDPGIERIIEERYGKKFSDGLRGRSKIGGSHSSRSPSRTRRRKYFDYDSDSDRKSKRHRRRRAIDSSSDSDSKSNQHRRKKEIDSGSDSDSDDDRRQKRRRHRRRKHRERRSVLSSGSESTGSSSDEDSRRRRRRRKHKH